MSVLNDSVLVTGGNAATLPPEAWARFARLRVVRNITEVIRRWFRVEIAFADPTGYVRLLPGGKVFEPLNPVCRGVLHDREGFKACMASTGEAHALVTRIGRPETGKGAPQRFGERVCHMGFRQIALPVEVDGKRIGSLIAGGLLPQGEPAGQRADLVEKGSRFGLARHEVEAAFVALPRVDELSLQYLMELLQQVVGEIVHYVKESKEREASIARAAEEVSGKYGFGAILGVSRPVREMLELLGKVAGSDSTVLLQGENGTGKELVARAVHYNSARRDKPFVMQSAAAFHENLLESELFGHLKGSFTGAVKDKKGLFEVADGGTFFLDEVGEMSAALQVKLLRVLQEGTFMPVGGVEPRRVNVRMLCATNRDLRRMVERGEFREDLFYRINVIAVNLPPLRDRREDIPLLARHFLKQMAVEKGEPAKTLSDEVLDRFYDYDWPGNVRELENEVERLVVMAGPELVIEASHLSGRIKERAMRANVRGVRVEKTLGEILEEVERRVISEGLRKTRWNKTQLARQLGISRKGLIAKVQRYQLDRRKEPRGDESGTGSELPQKKETAP